MYFIESVRCNTNTCPLLRPFSTKFSMLNAGNFILGCVLYFPHNHAWFWYVMNLQMDTRCLEVLHSGNGLTLAEPYFVITVDNFLVLEPKIWALLVLQSATGHDLQPLASAFFLHSLGPFLRLWTPQHLFTLPSWPLSTGCPHHNA